MKINAVSNSKINSTSVELAPKRFAFKGEIGDEFISKLDSSSNINLGSMVADVKAQHGLSQKVVTDLLESFVNRLQELKKVAILPLVSKSNELVEYPSAEYIKGFGEVTPKMVTTSAKEMLENRKLAKKSMLNYLLTGNGEQEAVKQLNRNVILFNAQRNGLAKLPIIESHIRKVEKVDIWPTVPSFYIRNFLKSSLIGHENGALVANKTIREKVRKNAIELLSPYCSSDKEITSKEDFVKGLDDIFDAVVLFHERLVRGLDRYHKLYDNAKFSKIAAENTLDFDTNECCLLIEDPYGITDELSFADVAKYGK